MRVDYLFYISNIALLAIIFFTDVNKPWQITLSIILGFIFLVGLGARIALFKSLICTETGLIDTKLHKKYTSIHYFVSVTYLMVVLFLAPFFNEFWFLVNIIMWVFSIVMVFICYLYFIVNDRSFERSRRE